MVFDNINLAKDSQRPLYRQLAEELKARINRGELQAGQKLPPVRAWPALAGISQVTANQAYELLNAEGYTTRQVGRGTYVRKPTASAAKNPERSTSPVSSSTGAIPDFPAYLPPGRGVQVQRLLQTVQQRYQAHPERPPDLINLASGSPAPELFALGRWKTAMQQAGEALERASRAAPTLLQYGSPLGDPLAREWLAGYLDRFGLNCSPEEILLTSGSQQALDLLARVFVGTGDAVLVESPTYISALEIFESRGAKLIGVGLDDRGMRTDELPALIERHRPRLLYCVPTAQSPAGVTLAKERRAQLLELADIYNLLVVEDDTCNEYYYGDEPAPPVLKSLDRAGRVIYLKSFSKLIFPMVRFGAVVAGGGLLERLAEAKAAFDRASSLPLARSVALFAGPAAFERELQAANRVYRARRDALVEALDHELAGSGASWSKCEGGFSLLLTVEPGIRSSELFLAAADQGVAVLPGPVYYPDRYEAPANTLRLSFGDNPPDRLREAARRLGRALQTFEQPRLALSRPNFLAAV